MGCVREGWLVAGKLVRQSATRTITAPTTRDNRRKVPDMKEVREGSTYSQDKDISLDFNQRSRFCQLVLVLSSFSRSGAMFGGGGGADGEAVAEEAGLGECGMIERGTVELGFLLAATSRHSLFPATCFLPPVALLPR